MDLRGALTSEAVIVSMGEALKEYRISRELTQKDLAERSGVSLRSISRFEQGEDIRFELLIKLLRALGLQDNLALLIPDVTRRPSYYLTQSRKRVRKKNGADNSAKAFKWGDEE